MGYLLFDQYSLLHFAVGVVVYFWYFNFWTAFSIHALFEFVENTPSGMRFLNKYFPKGGLFRWPGDKVKPDSLLNMIGDSGSFILGYLLAKLLDDLSNKRGWYYIH
jgi:hypothetical protein